MDKTGLEMLATDIIERLLKVVDEQKQTIVRYEGAIEGIKIFLKELKTKLDEKDAAQNGTTPSSNKPRASSPSQEVKVSSDDAIGS